VDTPSLKYYVVNRMSWGIAKEGFLLWEQKSKLHVIIYHLIVLTFTKLANLYFVPLGGYSLPISLELIGKVSEPVGKISPFTLSLKGYWSILRGF
jgi:hypothetical protein